MDPQEERIYTAILIVSLTLGIIIAYFFISIIRKQKRNLELQRSLVLKELTAIENERARIAKDLHDDISPMLSVVKFQVESVESASKEDAEELKTASTYIDDMLNRIREISNNLMPSSLLRKGLAVAVSEFVNKVKEATSMDIKFLYPAQLLLPEEMNANVYRIIQEVIHNCRKHAKATKMEIVLEEKNNVLNILIRDNGKGFDHKKVLTEGRGIGLSSIRNRAEVMRGTMTIESFPGKGSSFEFKIPLTKRTPK